MPRVAPWTFDHCSATLTNARGANTRTMGLRKQGAIKWTPAVVMFGGSLIKFLQNTVGPNPLRNPLLWALPLQALLLLSNLDLLDPWKDEWLTLSIVSKPLSQVVSTVAGMDHPPLYYVLLHYWIQSPWTVSPMASARAMSAV